MLQQYFHFTREAGGNSGVKRSWRNRINSGQPVCAHRGVMQPRFLASADLPSPNTVLAIRITSLDRESMARTKALILVDSAIRHAGSSPGELYAVRESSGEIVCKAVDFINNPEGPGAVIGKVISVFPGAQSLRYVSNLRLLDRKRKRRQQ